MTLDAATDSPAGTTTTVPYRLTRLGVVMAPEPGNPVEAEGVLNPASGRDTDGRLWLLPRLVSAGNVSRVGLAEVVVTDGVPTGVRRAGVVLEAANAWERGADHGGVEDPRTTWVPVLGLHVMTYVAFGPLGPRPALAVSGDLRAWRRLGPVWFRWEPELDADLNLYGNKDCVVFPEPVTAPDGRRCLAMLHRPTWDLTNLRPTEGVRAPNGSADSRPAIWISYAPLDDVLADTGALTAMGQHRELARGVHAWEALKVGAGPPPIRVPEGWLLLHHGVSGSIAPGWGPQTDVFYSAGAMILDADEPRRVLARTAEPLMAPSTVEEVSGTVGNVVFPTAVEQVDGVRYVFYGMADARIGVARLDHTG